MISRTTHRHFSLCMLLCLLPATGAISADVYKWTDEAGRVHYGDKPPDSNALPVEIRESPPVERDREKRRQKRDRLLEIFDEDRRRKMEKEEAARREKDKRARACAKARERLRKVVDAGFLYEKTGDPKNPRILTEDERQAETDRLRKQVGKWCR